nr:PREDICTED: receptor-interacting serine/threonine-protein kinase 3 isoform X2 [Paralichthys olivaceus]
MALSSCSPPLLIEDSSLTGWDLIGCGGFGQIYKVRHRQWCYDIAIKLLHYDDGSSTSLLREVEMMRQGSNEYVMQVLGVFKGRPPNSGPSAQLGLVMKYMEKGSLASLQTLQGVTPLPLVFRLAHQVALGINILHSLSPAVLHLDLKPSNVLLDSDLNAKLTDFGLAKFYHSVSRISKKDREDEGGTISYMPPEAFDTTYTPTRASDIYSYGILLWSIVSGKQPYAQAKSSIVRFRIPQGDRPSLQEFSDGQTEELKGLMELMTRCWEHSPTQRPSSLECTTITEELYKKHKHGIVDAVHEVQKKLEQKEQDRLTEQVQRVHIGQASGTPRVEAVNIQDNVLTGRPPVQEEASGLKSNQKFKDPLTSRQANTCHVDPARSSTGDHKAKASSVYPISASPASPSTTRSHQARAAENPQRAFKPNCTQQFQRQLSSPVPPSLPHKICITYSNVTGVQSGNENTMYINTGPERRRHPTAPPRVNPSSPQPWSWKNK